MSSKGAQGNGMKIETYQCELCPAVKQQSNHWLLALVYGAAVHFYPWDADVPDRDELKHICGQGCAAKLLSQTIEAWAKPSEPVPRTT
jgi:hypothetical protein